VDGGDVAAATEIDADLGWDAAANQRPRCRAGVVVGYGRGCRGEAGHVTGLVNVGRVVAGDHVEGPGVVSSWWKPAGGGGDRFDVRREDIGAGAWERGLDSEHKSG